MLIPVSDLFRIWKIQPENVLHVGAHLAEEEPLYRKYNWGQVTWVEAQPNLVKVLKKNLDPEFNIVYEAAVWDQSGVKLSLNIASNSQSTSLLEFGSHSESYPDISFTSMINVETKTLHDLLPRDYFPSFVNLDIQGVDLQALKGLKEKIKFVNWIYCEVNREEVYKNNTLLSDLDNFLSELGFQRLYVQWAPPRSWGDALYAKKGVYPSLQITLMRARQFTKSMFASTVIRKFISFQRKFIRKFT